MKTIGLIGGMSWESSKVYYELTNHRVKELLGGSHSSRSLMITVDFAEIERLTFEGRWDDIGEIIKDCAQKLEKGGADVIVLCTNTIHLMSDAITRSVSIPFLHIAEATGEAINKKQLKTVGLLGTKFTMEKDFYTRILKEQFHLNVITPNSSGRQVVHDIIYQELVHGKINQASKEKCQLIISDLMKQGAEGVILGCTELTLLLSESDVDVPLFDTSKIHAWKAVDWALAKSGD